MRAVTQAKEDVKKIIVQYQNKELEAMPGRSMMEAFETRVNAVLNKVGRDGRSGFGLVAVTAAPGVPVWGVTVGGHASHLNQTATSHSGSQCRNYNPL